MVRKNKQEIITMIICAFIAFLLWIYVMGEQNPAQTRNLENIPVYFTNLEVLEQNNLTILPNQKFTVSLKITGRAMDVYKIKPEDIRVEADLSGYVKKGYNNIPIEVKSIPKGINVVYDQGAPYVKVKVDSLVEKSVPVNALISGQVKEGFAYLTATIKPNEIIVRGPETYVYKASNALITIDVEKKDNDLTASLPIKIVDSYGETVQYVNYEPKYVDVNLPIKSAKDVDIIVKTKEDLPENKILNWITPKTSRVTIIGEKEKINSIKAIETEPIDLSKITTSIFKEVSLILPEGIFVKEDEKSITVDISVENKIEKTFNIKLNLENTNEELNYSLQSESTNLILVGKESSLNLLTDEDITAVVDVAGKAEGEYTLPIRFNIPKDFKIKKISNENAIVKITKK